VPPTDSAPFNKTLATFGRIWSAGMVPIIEKSGGWPGFRYTPEEEAEMREQVGKLSNANGLFLLFAFVNALIGIALFMIPILMMAWILTTLQRVHGQFPPETVFFAVFGATMAVALGVFLPLSVYFTSALFRNRSWNSDLTAADSEFGRRIFHKFCWQTTRVAIIAAFGMFLLSLWPEQPLSNATAQATIQKPLSFWERSATPLVALGAMSMRIMTLRYYYGGNRKPS
jgi:hypothetical protein